MENFLTVRTADGKDWHIQVIDTFSVDEYPNKNYIVYTFGEEDGPDMIKSYISVLNETDAYFTLEAMADKEEQEIVREAYQNMILESGEPGWQ